MVNNNFIMLSTDYVNLKLKLREYPANKLHATPLYNIIIIQYIVFREKINFKQNK